MCGEGVLREVEGGMLRVVCVGRGWVLREVEGGMLRVVCVGRGC